MGKIRDRILARARIQDRDKLLGRGRILARGRLPDRARIQGKDRTQARGRLPDRARIQGKDRTQARDRLPDRAIMALVETTVQGTSRGRMIRFTFLGKWVRATVLS